jgi:hypothetical protein
VTALDGAISVDSAGVGVVGENYCRAYKYATFQYGWLVYQGIILNLGVFSN